MTTCCDTYGHCSETDTCPLRTGVVLPHQAAYAARVTHRPSGRTCDELGVCKALPGCKHAPVADAVPPEAGNMQIIDLGPDDGWQALTLGDAGRWLRSNLPMLAWVLLLVVGAGLLSAWGTERYADVIWQLLAGVS